VVAQPAWPDHRYTSQRSWRRIYAHDTPEHNGVAERLNYTLANLVRAMVDSSPTPRSLWGYALMYAVWLKNRIPNKALEERETTPYEVVYGKKPDLSKAKEWGCRVFVKVKSKDKFDSRAREARYLGPSSETSDGFHIYWPETGRVTVERNVRFLDGCAFEGEKDTSPAAKREDGPQPTQPTQPTAPIASDASKIPLPPSPKPPSPSADPIDRQTRFSWRRR